MNGSLFTAVSSDLAVTQIEVYGSGRGFPGGKASFVMALRRSLRCFDLGSTLGDDLGTKVDVYESVDVPLGGGISWLNFINAARLAATEGAADFVSRSSSDRLTASRTASIWTLIPSFSRAADKASIRTTPKEGGFEIVADGGDIAQSGGGGATPAPNHVALGSTNALDHSHFKYCFLTSAPTMPGIQAPSMLSSTRRKLDLMHILYLDHQSLIELTL